MENTTLNFKKSDKLSGYKSAEKLLEDVMEIIDPRILEKKLEEVEVLYNEKPDDTNRTRLGIIYHEVAFYSSFYGKNKYKGYARKSYLLLDSSSRVEAVNTFLNPFQDSYKASSLALIGAETKNLSYVGKAFKEFEKSVNSYSEILYLPEFLRGSVAEKLPWFFFSKRKFAEKDFTSIVRKHKRNSDYANDRIMSFVYFGLALKAKTKKRKTECINYLEKVIAYDPNYSAARKNAEELKLIL